MNKTIDDFDLQNKYHRYQARKLGFDVPKQKPGIKRNDLESYMDKSGDCWIWTDRVNAWGYGFYTEDGKTKFSHREMYKRYIGQIAEGLVVMHKCDNPSCCNPKHLEIGSHRDNQLDKVKKGRQATGEKCGTSILTEKQVLVMREMYATGKYTYKQIADLYEVCKDTCQKAIRGINWGHI